MTPEQRNEAITSVTEALLANRSWHLSKKDIATAIVDALVAAGWQPPAEGHECDPGRPRRQGPGDKTSIPDNWREIQDKYGATTTTDRARNANDPRA